MPDDPFQNHLRAALASLVPGSFLLLEETLPERRGLGRLLGRGTPGRFVQARRDEDGADLLLEAIGPAGLGGGHPMDDTTLARLRSLGWLAPGDDGWDQVGGPLLRVFLPWSDLDRAAAMLVDTLRTLDVDPDTVRTTLG